MPSGRITKRNVLSNRRMRHITMHMLAIAMAAAVMGAAGTASVRPIPNPHVSDPTKIAMFISNRFVPQNTIFSPTQLQPDTFLSMETVKVDEASVPIYQFKQPERLSSLQLPFKLCCSKAFLQTMICTNLIGQQGLDSWFIGYKWSVLVCSSDCNGKNMHIGWHFKPVNSGEKGFYALIVKTDKKGNGIFSGVSLEAFREFIQVGVPAPAWMLTLLAAIAKNWAVKFKFICIVRFFREREKMFSLRFRASSPIYVLKKYHNSHFVRYLMPMRRSHYTAHARIVYPSNFHCCLQCFFASR